jgi:hypothetical protein
LMVVPLGRSPMSFKKAVKELNQLSQTRIPLPPYL